MASAKFLRHDSLKVIYPGLPGHSQYGLQRTDERRSGMIAFMLKERKR